MPTIARPSGAAWPDAAPPTTDDPLVGREALVADLASAFEDGAAHVVLSGLGGVGKTRIATEVARRLRRRVRRPRRLGRPDPGLP